MFERDDETVPGFAHHKLEFTDDELLYGTNVNVSRTPKILLPQELVKDLKNQARLQALAAEREVLAARKPVDVQKDKLEADAQQMAQAAQEAEARNDGTKVAVFDRLAPSNMMRDLQTRTSDRDVVKRFTALMDRLKVLGHLREMRPASKETLQDVNDLRESFPSFSAVLDLAQEQVELSILTGQGVSLPPILLGGPPGVGKTRFTQELASALGTTQRKVSFDSGVKGTVLLGSDKQWSNTSTGCVFEAVVLGQHANPVIVLDEIDKAHRYGHEDSSPLDPLHGLLEPSTANRVRDISADLEFDASHVIWIATANNLARIPPSLLSRFRQFWIEQPGGERAIQMARAVVRDLHQKVGKSRPFAREPSQRIAPAIAHLSAREQVQALMRAYARAASREALSIDLEDLPKEALFLDEPPQKDKRVLH